MCVCGVRCRAISRKEQSSFACSGRLKGGGCRCVNLTNMNRDSYKTLTWLMWLALPTTGLNYWLAWDRLPYRMAVHFDANWQPNG